MSLEVTLWGTRGSLPTPGPGTVRYGGNTPCVAVRSSTGAHLILDAGTGIRNLGQALGATGQPVSLTLALSHLHWDHIHGLPFFEPLYRAGNRVAIVGPRQTGDRSLERVLRAQMGQPVFPILDSAWLSDLTVTEFDPGAVPVAGFEVRTVSLCHPGATVGYSVADPAGGGRLIYMTDNELAKAEGTGKWPEFVRFLRDSDTLIHDAMYLGSEIGERRGWGHSSVPEVVLLALEAGVRRVLLFHHEPGHDDAMLDRLLAEAEEVRASHGGTLEIAIATEGDTFRC